jgi:hypothetical protein
MRIALLALPIALAACRKDQPVVSSNPANWSVTAVSGLLQPGSIDTVRFAATLDSGWYIYAITQKGGGPTPMSVSVEPSPPFSIAGDVHGPKPVTIFDKEFQIDTERYFGAPAFAATVAVASGAQSRPPSLNLNVRYQACNATLCLPARTATLSTPIRIASP